MKEKHTLWRYKGCCLVCAGINLLSCNLANGDGVTTFTDKGPQKRVIAGSVTVREPPFTPAGTAYFNAIGTPEKFSEALFSHFTGAVSNVTVRLLGNGVRSETRTDADGRFQFTGVTAGMYELSAEKNRVLFDGAQEVLSEKMMINAEKSTYFQICLGASFISVKGRVVNNDGKGASGVRVIGTPVPLPEAGRYDTFTAVSDKDGNYELKQIPAPSVWTIGGWLNGGDPARTYSLFYLQISAESSTTDDAVKQLPLVTENLLTQARQLREAMKSANSRLKMKANVSVEKPKGVIPKSQGNVIFVPDIVLDVGNLSDSK